MKKIVALVLAMVMVLGLATTAFAATPAYVAEAGKEGTPIALATGTDLSTCTFKLEKQVDEIAVNQTFAKYVIWATNKETKAPVQFGPYVLAASAESADLAFVDGTTITYLSADVQNWTKGLTVSKVASVDVDDASKCGEIFAYGDAAVYSDAAKNLYIEQANGTPAYVDGKLVELVDATEDVVTVKDLATNVEVANTVYIVGHTYDYDAKTVNGEESVTKVFCSVCKAEFAFVQGYETQAIAKFGAGNYANTFLNVQPGLWVKTASTSAPAADADGETVESAKTFDAGIAMYVGMSVMAAAGSAVVLKKKD